MEQISDRPKTVGVRVIHLGFAAIQVAHWIFKGHSPVITNNKIPPYIDFFFSLSFSHISIQLQRVSINLLLFSFFLVGIQDAVDSHSRTLSMSVNR